MNIMNQMRKGATFIEYALLAGLVAIVIAGGAVVFGDKIKALFSGTGSTTDKVTQKLSSLDLSTHIK